MKYGLFTDTRTRKPETYCFEKTDLPASCAESINDQLLFFFFRQSGGTDHAFIGIHTHQFYTLGIAADDRDRVYLHPNHFADIGHEHQIVIIGHSSMDVRFPKPFSVTAKSV